MASSSPRPGLKPGDLPKRIVRKWEDEELVTIVPFIKYHQDKTPWKVRKELWANYFGKDRSTESLRGKYNQIIWGRAATYQGSPLEASCELPPELRSPEADQLQPAMQPPAQFDPCGQGPGAAENINKEESPTTDGDFSVSVFMACECLSTLDTADSD